MYVQSTACRTACEAASRNRTCALCLAWGQYWMKAPELNFPTPQHHPGAWGPHKPLPPTCCIWRPLCRLYCSCIETLDQLFRPVLQQQAAVSLLVQQLLCWVGPVLEDLSASCAAWGT